MDCSQPALLSMRFSRQEYCSGLPCPRPGNLPAPGMETVSPFSCINRQGGSLPLAPPKSSRFFFNLALNICYRKWQSTPVFLPGKFHGQKSLVGYSQSIELQRVRRDWASTLSYVTGILSNTTKHWWFIHGSPQNPPSHSVLNNK